ncbi:MAG: outer membrane protein transport protein [Desulfobacterales bacterium]|nr:outer membrane protein transport protein [Desulfobacterales bacterium]MDD4071893.1 outer membrane protein transport protein [Desulfobacterales bacterium]MDD4392502.1 outer membrane protein transport protein [Desulfobacterales bacterium]
MILRIISKVCFMLLIALAAVSCFFSGDYRAEASGFAIYTHGAKELGMANAVTAHSEGAASNFFNPALLGEIEGNQVEAGTSLIYPGREYTGSASGETVSAESQLYFPSTLFGVYHLNDRCTAGVGITSPFGLGTSWPDDWEGRYIVTDVEMATFMFNPNIALKVTDRLTVAGGIDMLYADAVFENNMLLIPGFSDAESKFEGDDIAWGYNLGLLFKLTEATSLGMAYRSGMDLHLEGTAEFVLPSSTPTALRAMLPNTGGSATMQLPSQLFVGLACKLKTGWLIEAGAIREEWSRYDNVVFHFDTGLVSVKETKWNNSMAYMLGVKYNITPTDALTVGYLYNEDPIPDDTFDPQITASKKQALSAGWQMYRGNWGVAVSWMYERYDDRIKDNQVDGGSGLTANGTYEQYTHIGALSVTYRF